MAVAVEGKEGTADDVELHVEIAVAVEAKEGIADPVELSVG